jgi:hypothetical protein
MPLEKKSPPFGGLRRVERKILPETDNIRTWLRSQNPVVLLNSEVLPGYQQAE